MDGVAALAYRSDFSADFSHECHAFAFQDVIDGICAMPWERLTSSEVLCVAKAYYFFSIQFRENLDTACELRPGDEKLQSLREGECDTDNLSPYPGVTAPGEKVDHDEFMRRLLAMQPVDSDAFIENLGRAYLGRTRGMSPISRATSIASYEDGGLSRVFMAMLRAPDWRGAGQEAFRFFLEEHIRFDTEDEGGHGSLSRHLPVSDNILPLWTAFAELLTGAVPRLAHSSFAALEAQHAGVYQAA